MITFKIEAQIQAKDMAHALQLVGASMSGAPQSLTPVDAPIVMEATPAIEPEKPATTRNRAKKGQIEEPKSGESPAPEKVETPEPVKVETPEEPKEEGPSKDDLKAALSELIAAGKEDDVRSILGKYGVDKISALKPSQYDAVIADAKAVV